MTNLDYKVSLEEASSIINKFLESSDFRSTQKERTLEKVYSISSLEGFRSSSKLHRDIDDAFYVAQFKDDLGYALISKDKRTFPIFAVLDKGDFSKSDMNSLNEDMPIKALINGHRGEIMKFNSLVSKKLERFRSDTNEPAENSENAIQEFLDEG